MADPQPAREQPLPPGETAGRPQVAVVTDSTAYLPAGVALAHALTVVPLQVTVDGRSLAEGIEVTSEEVALALRARRSVTTSRPSPATFVNAYRERAAAGASAVVSVHLSGDLSGTVEAARLAARTVATEGIEVEVVDSRMLGMGLGWVTLAAARAAAAGAARAEVAVAARRRALSVGCWVYVDTLEYLHRGGRIGAAQALLGSALAVKPLLQLVDGRLEPLDRARTASRALARLEEIVSEEAPPGALDVVVHHLAAQERAADLGRRLAARLPGVRSVEVSEVGAVVGAHVGPGMLAILVAPVLQG